MLSPSLIHQWKTSGYCIAHSFFPSDDYSTAHTAAHTHPFEDTCDFGSKDGCLEFPTDVPALNHLTLHPNLIRSVQALLNTDDVRLIQSDVWSKTGHPIAYLDKDADKDTDTYADTNQDQRMHMDYPNNYLTYPNENWNTPESVAAIVYFDDERECGGGTRVVPRMGESDPAYQHPFTQLPGLGHYAFHNNRTLAESYFRTHHPDVYTFRQSLYDREISVSFRPNTVLFYRHDLWHRGFPLLPGQQRIVMNLGFKRAGCDWITCWNRGWARGLCWTNRKMETFVQGASPLQRMCLGFPGEGSSYWTETQVGVMKMRYGRSRL